jgi:hypothetical protein
MRIGAGERQLIGAIHEQVEDRSVVWGHENPPGGHPPFLGLSGSESVPYARLKKFYLALN